ncbi:MAG: ATP-dependent helicase [Candidatus Pacearchaeota archaeon]
MPNENIKLIEKPSSKEELLSILHPLVKEWFFSRFKEFSLPQLYGVLPIWKRQNILISAPTGGTKTLTAFLAIINYLVGLAEKHELEDKIYALYVSPLRALNNDILVNLKIPLTEIAQLARKKGIKLQEIRIGLRTSDTSIDEKAKQLKRPPHILITTPESLAIILSSKRFIERLKAVEFVVVDEIHALANKRGAHLSLSLERLSNISAIEPVRIGLSATIAPLEEVAKFLVGYHWNPASNSFEQRPCLIADARFAKPIEVSVLMPTGFFENAEIQSTKLYSLMNELIQKHSTTLIFTNTRSGTERVIEHLKERFPRQYEAIDGSGSSIGAHHSSLSRRLRFEIEKRLREGKLKAIVSSTSLELGIDIGFIDLVLLLGSPKSIARASQRIGRSGHKLHEKARGIFLVLDRDDLIECSIMAKKIIEGEIDKVQIPKNCLDVLCQHVYGEAINKVWHVDDFYRLVRQSYCFNGLSKEQLLNVISYLSGQYFGLEQKGIYAKIWYDENTRQFGRRSKLARMLYMTNLGVIPEESYVNVIIAVPRERKDEKIGVIDEAFLERLKPGDVFVLGGEKYMFMHARGMNAYVNASVKQPPTIPSWFSEMLPLSFDLARAIAQFRALMEQKLRQLNKKETKASIIEWIKAYCHCNENVAREIYDYFYEQFCYAEIPHSRKLLIELYKAVDGKKYWIFHSLYGRRVNDALSRALAFLTAKLSHRDIEIGINDNGFYLASYDQIQVERALEALIKNWQKLEMILNEAIEKTEVFKRRFRHNAVRSFLILKSYMGKTKSAGKLQLQSDMLYSSVKAISPNFPVIAETRREVLEDVMDIANAKLVLEQIASKKIEIKKITTDLPSPFALNLVAQGYLDLLKIEDRIEFLRRMHEKILERIEKKKGN